MPYFVHPADVPITTERPVPCPVCADESENYPCYCLSQGEYSPITGVWWQTLPQFATRAQAVEYVNEGHTGNTIAFKLTRDERLNWQYREDRKLSTGEYIALPWNEAVNDRSTEGYTRYYEVMGIANRYETEHHIHAHLALKHAGQVAFTLNDEHGFNDRQTVIRPGRFLERFYPDLLTTLERDRFVAACTQNTAPLTMTIARTTEDIVALYNVVNDRYDGGSCMQRKPEAKYSWQSDMDAGLQPHPCSVYGESDLGVAYLGPVSAVRCRVVVWPDKKRHCGKFYGQEAALRAALEAAGYSQGSFVGARMRYVACDNGIVMPYIDPCSTVEHDGGNWLILGHGDIDARVTQGWTEATDSRGTCEHCSDATDRDELDDHGGRCESCDNQRACCSSCDDTIWTDNDEYTSHDNGVWCESCADGLRRTCGIAGCDETWIEETLTRTQRRRRDNDGTSTLCLSCEGDYTYCSDCDSWYVTADHTQCPNCATTPDDPSTDDLPFPSTIDLTVGPCRVCEHTACVCGASL